MFNHKLRIAFIVFVVALVFVGLANIESLTYTGKSVHNPGKHPLVAAVFELETNELQKDVLYDLLDKEDANILLKSISGEEKHYLLLRWNKKIDELDVYMRKVGSEGEAYFEIWGPEDRKIASGNLSNEYELYGFDLSGEEMSFEDYAIFNYGPSDIKIDKVFGAETPEPKTSRIIGILTEGFI